MDILKFSGLSKSLESKLAVQIGVKIAAKMNGIFSIDGVKEIVAKGSRSQLQGCRNSH